MNEAGVTLDASVYCTLSSGSALDGASALCCAPVKLLLAFLVCGLVLGLGGCQPKVEGRMALNIDFSMDRFALGNGLQVVLHRDPSATSALVHVRYQVGSKDDPVGRSGFAHFFEHLMFRGSRYTRAKDYAQWIDEVGGRANADTTLDTTDYYAQVPPSALTRSRRDRR